MDMRLPYWHDADVPALPPFVFVLEFVEQGIGHRSLSATRANIYRPDSGPT